MDSARTSLARENAVYLRDMPFMLSAHSQSRRPDGTLADDLVFLYEMVNVTKRSGEYCWIGKGWISSRYLGSPFKLTEPETLDVRRWWVGSQTIAAGVHWCMYVDWSRARAYYNRYDLDDASDKVEASAKVAMEQKKRAWDALHDCVPSEPQSMVFLAIAFPKIFSFWSESDRQQGRYDDFCFKNACEYGHIWMQETDHYLHLTLAYLDCDCRTAERLCDGINSILHSTKPRNLNSVAMPASKNSSLVPLQKRPCRSQRRC